MVAIAFAPQPPPLSPIPFAHVFICEGEYILNLQVEGLPECFMPISDPILPYAKDASTDAEVPVAYA